uniref:PRKCSH_1 domain-containing protein n=1 Tax=Onchocerca flexuosa TaxID=387005 RepID=A0A183HDF4_9BILA
EAFFISCEYIHRTIPNFRINFLLKWSGWIGTEPNKYALQSYEHGTPCWNGPDRSTKVVIECGEETQLVEVSEPSKCEYLFILRSPAACPDPATITDQHEEL